MLLDKGEKTQSVKNMLKEMINHQERVINICRDASSLMIHIGCEMSMEEIGSRDDDTR